VTVGIIHGHAGAAIAIVTHGDVGRGDPLPERIGVITVAVGIVHALPAKFKPIMLKLERGEEK
jgi:hypothetical protein